MSVLIVAMGKQTHTEAPCESKVTKSIDCREINKGVVVSEQTCASSVCSMINPHKLLPLTCTTDGGRSIHTLPYQSTVFGSRVFPRFRLGIIRTRCDLPSSLGDRPQGVTMN